MTDKEKEAYNFFKKCNKKDLENFDYFSEPSKLQIKYMETVLSLIKTQQEEIEILKQEKATAWEEWNIIDEYCEQEKQKHKEETVLNLLESYRLQIIGMEKEIEERNRALDIVNREKADLLEEIETYKDIKEIADMEIQEILSWKNEIIRLNSELEKKDKIIDEMAEKLSYVEDLKLDVCVYCKEDCRIPRNEGDYIKTDCIKKYFINKCKGE